MNDPTTDSAEKREIRAILSVQGGFATLFKLLPAEPSGNLEFEGCVHVESDFFRVREKDFLIKFGETYLRAINDIDPYGDQAIALNIHYDVRTQPEPPVGGSRGHDR
jgi:hypothetical protein